MNDIYEYYNDSNHLSNYSLILLVDKNTSEQIWAMYYYFQPLSFSAIIIPKKRTVYSLKTINERSASDRREPLKIILPHKNNQGKKINENNILKNLAPTIYTLWNGKTWDFKLDSLDRHSEVRNITDDYDVYCTINSIENDEMLVINYYMKGFVNISNPIKDLVLANESISKDINRTSLPETSIRDIASFIDPKYGLPSATRKGGRKHRRHVRKSRKRL